MVNEYLFDDEIKRQIEAGQIMKDDATIVSEGEGYIIKIQAKFRTNISTANQSLNTIKYYGSENTAHIFNSEEEAKIKARELGFEIN